MFLLQALAFVALSAGESSPRSNLVVAPCDGGDRQQFEVFNCDIPLKNIGDTPIVVSRATAINASDSIDGGSVTVPAHATAYIVARVNVQDRIGYVKRSFKFSTSEPGVLASRASNVMAFVSTALDQKAPTMDFGAVDAENEQPVKVVALSSREVQGFRIVEVLAKPDYLDVSLDANSLEVRAKMKKGAPLGLHHDKIKLKINTPLQAEAWISVEANVQGAVRVDGNPFSLGLMRTNGKNEFLVRVSSVAGKDFNLGQLTLEGVQGHATAEPCSPAAEGCKLVRLTIAGDQARGRVQGMLNIELPDEKRKLPVELVGMLLSPEMEVHDFNKELDRARERKGEAKSNVTSPSEASKAIDIGKALVRSTDKVHAAPPEGQGPLLAWSVANEQTIYAYMIYRADAEAGPFLRINKDLIKASAADGTSTGSYQWRDNSAKPGKIYWYYIGLLKTDGEKERLTGSQKMIAK
ncbi:MAG: hypothetical protein ABIR62_02010 [Dokdonella sp.]|uniref:hypothetical protein n=1 Tax=Dokdonella sp. TaxID=2291710 RepID=UPI0032636C15